MFVKINAIDFIIEGTLIRQIKSLDQVIQYGDKNNSRSMRLFDATFKPRPSFESRAGGAYVAFALLIFRVKSFALLIL